MKFLSHPIVSLLSSLFQFLYGLKLLGVIQTAGSGTTDTHKLLGGILVFSGLVGFFLRNKSVTQATTVINLSGDQIIEIEGLLQADRKIEAIKNVRKISGCGLLEAKNYIEKLKK